MKLTTNELQSAFEDAVTRAEKAEGERDALADALREAVRLMDKAWRYDGDVFGIEHNNAVDWDINVQKLLAQVRK